MSVLTPGAIVLSTVLGVALAAAGLATLPRLTPRPVGVFRRLAVVVGILSLLGPVAAAVGLVSEVPAVSGEIFVTLALMNLLTTATIILLLPPTAAMRD